MNPSLQQKVSQSPKAELHVHLEGTLEPAMALAFAKRNNITFAYQHPHEITQLYSFTCLEDFLRITKIMVQVLQTEQDFYELLCAYCDKALRNNIVHAEVFFNPQAHTMRGIPFNTVISGLKRGIAYGASHGISIKLIMCFERDLSAEDAEQVLDQALSHKEWIIAVGLDSAERDNPPNKFVNVFRRAFKEGFLTVAHAGEEGPPEFIWQTIELLKVSRIDHGVRCVEDPRLVTYLANHHIPLTMCPLSNRALQVVADLKQYPAKKLLNDRVCVTVNSDDPAYFGGYLNDNYNVLINDLKLTHEECISLLKNSFKASFMNHETKNAWIEAVNAVWR